VAARRDEVDSGDRLYRVQRCVCGRRTALDPVCEAVATSGPIVGLHVDRFGRATFHHLDVDATPRQRAALKDGTDRRPRLSL
jgi:hypothetical protein